MTLDAAEIDLSKAFTPGMGYVALSRVRNLTNLYLLGMNNMALQVSEEAIRIEHELRRASREAVEGNAALFEAAEESWKVEASTPKAEPKQGLKKVGAWNEKIGKMREEYPNAYKPW